MTSSHTPALRCRWFSTLAHALDPRSGRRLAVLLLGLILARGRKTLSSWIRAAGLCHTDLEVIEGSLRYPMPIVLGHEAAGVAELVGSAARGVKVGDHVVLSWNPHCGHCFHCDRDAPILCEQYLGEGPKGVSFDGEARTRLADGRPLQQLMFMGSFGEYCVVADQQGDPTELDSVGEGDL